MPCSIRSLYPRNFYFFILNKMLPISSKIKSNLWLSFDLIIIFRLYVHYDNQYHIWYVLIYTSEVAHLSLFCRLKATWRIMLLVFEGPLQLGRLFFDSSFHYSFFAGITVLKTFVQYINVFHYLGVGCTCIS